jgi:hypothetical protein
MICSLVSAIVDPQGVDISWNLRQSLIGRIVVGFRRFTDRQIFCVIVKTSNEKSGLSNLAWGRECAGSI